MSRVCEICGKRSQIENRIETRGKAKYLGDVSTKITGKTGRNFLLNLRSAKVSTTSGANATMKVCARCIRGGVIRKAIKQKPFRLPT